MESQGLAGVQRLALRTTVKAQARYKGARKAVVASVFCGVGRDAADGGFCHERS